MKVFEDEKSQNDHSVPVCFLTPLPLSAQNSTIQSASFAEHLKIHNQQ